MASKLPRPNLLLLKSLLALMANISQGEATSRMSLKNLAICVGPNLLSPPEEDSLPLQMQVEVTGKVSSVASPLGPPGLCCSQVPGCILSSANAGVAAAKRSSPTAAAFWAESRLRSGRDSLRPLQPAAWKPMVCPVQVTQLVELLMELHLEVFEEADKVAAAVAEEAPAPEPSSTEVSEDL